MPTNSSKWGAAAARYNGQTQESIAASRQEREAAWRDEKEKSEMELELARRKTVAILALEQFMRGEEGDAAKALLKASAKHINFGVDSEDSQTTLVYFIDGHGLRSCSEASASWGNAYSALAGNKLPEPNFSSMTAEQAVNAAMTYNKMQPEQVLPFLRDELNKIAEAAP